MTPAAANIARLTGVDGTTARATFAAITPRGRALVQSARASHHELLRGTFGRALNDRDIADLARIMSRIDASIIP